jgi:hypothetical protein
MTNPKRKESTAESVSAGVSLYFDPVTRLLQRDGSAKDGSGDRSAAPADSPSAHQRAEKWLDEFVSNTAGIAIAAFVPGAMTGSLFSWLQAMTIGIGRIYRGDSLRQREIAHVLNEIAWGPKSPLKRILTSELLSFIPVLGWLAKGATLTYSLKGVGREIIDYFDHTAEPP